VGSAASAASATSLIRAATKCAAVRFARAFARSSASTCSTRSSLGRRGLEGRRGTGEDWRRRELDRRGLSSPASTWSSCPCSSSSSSS
ncbi:hypothetical protein PFISCL1PPCAC_14043, partial [Pristionchus fissidentatus]